MNTIDAIIRLIELEPDPIKRSDMVNELRKTLNKIDALPTKELNEEDAA